MKTNQVMIRPLGNFSVEQRTKDGMFNATALLRQWNESRNEKKEITKFFDNISTKEFIQALIEEENLNTQNSAYLKSRGKNGGTWMHPILFVKFAMWLNPAFEVKVIKFVYDQMIAYRNEAAEAYKDLASAVSQIVTPQKIQPAMRKIAEAINWCVFNEHCTSARNKYGIEEKMRQLVDLECKVAMLIKEGFIRSLDEVINYLRRQWLRMNPAVRLN